MPIKRAKKTPSWLLSAPHRKRRGWKFRYEKWQKPMLSIIGTIRTVPENYYVADVRTNGILVFGGIEAMTRYISKATVRKWWKESNYGR